MIGTGIFLKPSEMAAEGGSISIVFAAWIVGGVLSIFGALCYAELGASIPEAGGEYAYLRRGLGISWGFLFGWMHSMIARPASGAAIAAGLLRFCTFVFPVLATPLHTFHSHSMFVWGYPTEFVITWEQPLAVGALALISIINYLGVRQSGRVQIALTILKIGAVAGFVVVGFLFLHGRAQNLRPMWPTSPSWGTLRGFFAALAAAMWAYDGWNDLNLVGSEVQNPGRNIPRALVGGTALVALLFLAFTAVCFYALPFDQVVSSPHVASDVFKSFAGQNAGLWITLAMVISAIGTLNSSILSGARVDYAMARDRLFFRFAAAVHPRFRTPGNALIFQCGLASLMVMTGSFEDLTSLVMFGSWIFYGLAAIAMFRLRRLEPNLSRPYCTWGYPIVPGVFVLGAVSLAVSLWIARPVRSTIGLAVVLGGLLFYRSWSRNTGSP